MSNAEISLSALHFYNPTSKGDYGIKCCTLATTVKKNVLTEIL